MKACRALDDRACATVRTRSQRSPEASRSQSLCDKTSPGCSPGVGFGGHARGRGRPRQARRPRGLGCSQLSLLPTSRSVSRLLRRPAGARARGTQWYPEAPHAIPLNSSISLALGALLHASNLHWSSSLHMVIHVFQCYTLKSLHPCFLPQSPKAHSLHLCLYICVSYMPPCI